MSNSKELDRPTSSFHIFPSFLSIPLPQRSIFIALTLGIILVITLLYNAITWPIFFLAFALTGFVVAFFVGLAYRQARELEYKLGRVERIKQEWEATVDALPELICLLDENARVIRSNRASERWELKAVQNVKGEGLHNLLHPNCGATNCELDRLLQASWQEIGLGEAVEKELWDDVLQKHLVLKFRPLIEPTERQRQVISHVAVVIVQNITDRKETEDALQESRLRLRRVIDSISDHIYVTDFTADGDYINSYFSPNVEALTGYPPHKLSEDWKFWPSKIIYPEDRATAEAQARQLEKGQDSEVEYRLIRADGTMIWVRDSSRVESFGATKTIYGVVSDITESKLAEEELHKTVEKLKVAYQHASAYAQELHEEITERELMEEALRQSEERVRSVVNNVVDGIITTDDKGVIESFNPAAEKIFGYRLSDIQGQNVELLLPELENTGGWNNWRFDGPMLTGYSRETIGLRQNHTVFPMDLAVSEFYLGEQKMFIGIVRDITAHKELEEQLRQSQKMEAIGRLAGGVAHDFNNILTIISGYSELLLREFPDPNDPRRGDVDSIKQASERATNLTRQLLAFSRQQTLRPQRLNLNVLILNLEKMLKRLLTAGIELVTSQSPDIGYVLADPGQIDQVLLNLAVNARDAMPDGGTLTIETKNVQFSENYIANQFKVPSGTYVLLAVKDTGTGMADEILGQIFDPFFTTKEQGKGTGLGLSTVYGIVRQSNGYIVARSELQQGTSFEIYLPVVSDEVPQLPEDSPQAEGVMLGKETILLVEDEANVRRIACRFLERQGYTVLAAKDPEIALHLWQEHEAEIDLLVTDVIMPYMNGRELADQLLAHRPNLKMLFISGYADETLTDKGVLDPDILLLEKPFSSDELFHKIQIALDGDGPTESSSGQPDPNS